MNADLALALELADEADVISLDRFRAVDLRVETKPDLTPVSDADRAVEEAIRARLAVARPDHSVVGEEYGTEGGGPWRWIVDPIDGTKNYVRGVPVFGTLLALEHDGTLQLGVVSAPALRRRWWAVRGAGAFADGKQIHVSGVGSVADAMVSYDTVVGFSAVGLERQFLDLCRACWRTRGLGDFWSHMLVAEGAIDVAVEAEVSLWDVAAVQVIVEEAGGRFTDLAGEARPDGGSALSTNGLLHDDVLARLRP